MTDLTLDELNRRQRAHDERMLTLSSTIAECTELVRRALRDAFERGIDIRGTTVVLTYPIQETSAPVEQTGGPIDESDVDPGTVDVDTDVETDTDETDVDTAVETDTAETDVDTAVEIDLGAVGTSRKVSSKKLPMKKTTPKKNSA